MATVNDVLSFVVALIPQALSLAPQMPYAVIVIALLIDLAKKLGLLKDGAAGLVSLILNFIAYMIFIYVAHLNRTEELIALSNNVATVLSAAIGLLGYFGVTAMLHTYFVAHGVGFSYTLKLPLVVPPRNPNAAG